METALEESNSMEEFMYLLEQKESTKAEDGDLDTLCSQLQALISSLQLSKDVIESIGRMFPGIHVLLSVPVPMLGTLLECQLLGFINSKCLSFKSCHLSNATSRMWASLYTWRAVLSCRAAGVPQKNATMAVLEQEMISPDLSFVFHTQSPTDHDHNIVEKLLLALERL